MEKKQKGKRNAGWDEIDGGMAFIIPLTLLRHPNFTRLSPWGVKLVMDLGRQYTGFNNGYLHAGRKLMRAQGWKSNDTLRSAIAECEHYLVLVRTKQGGRNAPTYHGFTWRKIDDRKGRALDVPPSLLPSDAWKDEQQDYQRTAGVRKVAKTRRLRVVK